MTELIRVIVKGYVQGVGFRYFCYQKAGEYGIKGYVRNLYNGDVELEIEGEDGILKDYIKEINIGPRASSVDSVHIEKLGILKNYKEFSIR